MSDETPRGRSGDPGPGRTFERGSAHADRERAEQEREAAARDRAVAERDRDTAERDRGAGDPDRAGAAAAGTAGAVSKRERYEEMRKRQRAEYGGFNLGAAFFGWLVAVGLGALLTALLSAVGSGVGLTNPPSAGEAAGNPGTVGIAGGIALLVVLFIAYYAGGYVAGRMSRFNGAKQGFGVWAIALAVTLVLAGAGAIAGAEFNVLSQLNLPRIPVDEGSLATSGVIALLAIVVVTLVAAVLGGKVGVRYHKKVDRAGLAA
jgi:hypothetical protein